MDPMTIIGIVQFATSTALSLYEYVGDVKGAPDDVAELANQLDGIVIHIKELQRLLIENKTTHGWSEGGTRLAEHSISDCGIVLDKLRKIILKSGANVKPIDKTVVDSQDIQQDFFQSLLWPIIGKNKLIAIREELQRTKIDILLAQVSYREATKPQEEVDQKALAEKIAALWRAKQSSAQRGAEATRKSMRDPVAPPSPPAGTREPPRGRDMVGINGGGQPSSHMKLPNGHAREPSGAVPYLIDDEIEKMRKEVEAWDRKHRKHHSTSSTASMVLPSHDPHIDPYQGIKFVADTVVDMARSALKERAETKAKLDLLFGALESIADSTGTKLGLNTLPTTVPAILRDSHNVGGIATTHAVNLARKSGPSNEFEAMEADWSLEQLVKRLTPTKQDRQRGESAPTLAIANLQYLPSSCREWITKYLYDNKGETWHWVLILADPIRSETTAQPKKSWFSSRPKSAPKSGGDIVGVQLVFKKCTSSSHRSDHPHTEKMISNVTDLAQILVNFLWIRAKNRAEEDHDTVIIERRRSRSRSRRSRSPIVIRRSHSRIRRRMERVLYSSSPSDSSSDENDGRRMFRERERPQPRTEFPVAAVPHTETRIFGAPTAIASMGDAVEEEGDAADIRYGVSRDMDDDQIARRILESYTERRRPDGAFGAQVVDPVVPSATATTTAQDAEEKLDLAAETVAAPS